MLYTPCMHFPVLPDRRRLVLLIATLVLLVGAAFGATLRGEFLAGDDHVLIVENPIVRNLSYRIFTTYDPELYIPTTLATFQLETLLLGLHAWHFHLASLLLHAGNAVMVVWLLFLLLGRSSRGSREPPSTTLRESGLPAATAAFCGGLIFLLHPLQTESVAWISARKELLATTFALATLLWYMHADEGRRGRMFSWGTLLFLLALTSKPSVILLPFALLVIDFHERGRVTFHDVIRKWPYALLSLLFGLLGLLGKEAAISLSPLQTFLLAARSTTFYLQKFLLPVGLSPIYPAPPIDLSPAFIASVLIVAMLIAAAWIMRRRAPLVSVGIALFFTFLIPSFLSYGHSSEVMLGADRYMYLPSVGLILIFCLVIQGFWSSIPKHPRNVFFVGLLGIVGLFGFLSHVQSNVWLTSDAHSTRVLALYPNSAIGQNNLGFALLSQGKLQEAVPYFERAIGRNPLYADAIVNLAVVRAREGRLDEADALLRRSLAAYPGHAQTHFNLAGIALTRGDLLLAEHLYEETLRLRPYYAPALWQLAQAEWQRGKSDEAAAHYRALLLLDDSYRGKIPVMDALLEPNR
ncbi:MAG: hypothetical protein Greene041619_398 [Candidatus Peregrinibacteria bacterium Greene0416_19]|nr:MAG: hypothetical protein Greene041619_398 [Candidatus Peregrinibacteria bacterium Greene0416_19]